MLARWLAKLSQYNFTVEYREGKLHTNANALIRRRCHGCPRIDCPDKLAPLQSESMCPLSADSDLTVAYPNPAGKRSADRITC